VSLIFSCCRALACLICSVLSYLIGSSVAFALDPERGLEQYNYKQWGVEAQLPQISVTALAQDNKGYIWIGTQNGIARFNGKDFVSYNRDNTNAFQSNLIIDLLYDSNNRLWVLTNKGLTYYSSNGFVAVHSLNQEIIKPFSIIEYQNRPLVSSFNGLFKIKNNQYSPYKISTESFALHYSSLGLFVGGRGRFSIINGDDVTTKTLPKEFKHAIVNDIQVIDNKVWLATTKGLIFYENEHFQFPLHISSLIKEPTNKIYLDENNILWVATDASAYRIKDDKLHDKNNQSQYARISEFMLDRDGTLWFGTSDNGLFHLWDSWAARYNKIHGLQENLIWSVAGDSLSNLIVGSDKAVYKYSEGAFKKLIDKNQLPNPTAYTLFIDYDESIWVGTKSGLAHFDKQGKTITPLASSFLNGLQINAIYRDSRNRLWVATSKGIYLKKQFAFSALTKKDEFSKRIYRAIIEYNNEIYFGSHTGLIKLGTDLKLVKVFKQTSNSFITAMTIYKDKLIVGSYSDGLFFNDNGVWSNINKKRGLVTNDSFSLKIFSNALWVSGFHGVFKISSVQIDDFLAKKINRVVSEPILKDSGYLVGSQHVRCCNGAGHAKVSLVNNSLWYPTLDGVLKLDPHKVIKNTIMVETEIESISSSGLTIPLYSFDAISKKQDQISFVEKDISFKFIGITSFDEGLVNYRYRLKGYDDNWKENQSRREVFYTNLPARNFVFEVMASNSNGLWPNNGKSFSFTIMPRYYETTIFKLLAIFVFFGMLYLTYQWVIFSNIKKLKKLESLVNAKTKELTSSNQKLEKANQKLSVYSYTDPLTGAFNRRYLVKQMSSDISHYIRNNKKYDIDQNLVFILADLDFFKNVNDKYGHATGDEILEKVVSRLNSNIRDGDYLIRWGGEEFLIVLRPDHVARIEEMCDRLLKDINGTIFHGIHREEISITLSVGYCFYPLSDKLVKSWRWENAVDIADKALYESKSRGRNQWVGYQLLPDFIDTIKPDLTNAASHQFNIDMDKFQRFAGKG